MRRAVYEPMAGKSVRNRTDPERTESSQRALAAAMLQRSPWFGGCQPATHEALLNARRDSGFARLCHADLHLGNILLENGRPVLFDCIEFNDILSDIDVQYDLAFLLMDLDFRRRRDAAVRVLSAYVDEGRRHAQHR